jgi:hypothetical protein
MSNTSKRLVICYRSIYTNENMAIHAHDCIDVLRSEKMKYDANIVPHVGSIESAINAALDEEMRENGL